MSREEFTSVVEHDGCVKCRVLHAEHSAAACPIGFPFAVDQQPLHLGPSKINNGHKRRNRRDAAFSKSSTASTSSSHMSDTTLNSDLHAAQSDGTDTTPESVSTAASEGAIPTSTAAKHTPGANMRDEGKGMPSAVGAPKKRDVEEDGLQQQSRDRLSHLGARTRQWLKRRPRIVVSLRDDY